MKKYIALCLLLTMVLSAVGCGCGNRNQIVENTPTPSPTQDAVQNEVLPSQNQQTVNRGSYAFSRLEQSEDGTTTDVLENACTLHYNADMFTLQEAESTPYGAAFMVNGGMGVDYITVRIAESKDEWGMLQDCFDYFNLQVQDDAQPDDLEDIDTKHGEVTYYITTSDLEGDGQNVRAYYALNMGDVAFCGTMDIALDAEAMLLDEMLLREYAEEFFDEGIARTVFENLFMDVEVNKFPDPTPEME